MTMRSKRGGRVNVRLILAGVLVFAALVGAGLFVQTVNRTYTAAIAIRLINAGSPLAPTDFEIRTFNGDPPTDQLINNSQVEGYLGKVATTDIHTDAPLLSSDFFVPLAPGATPAPGDPQAGQAYTWRFSELLGPDDRAVLLVGDPTSALIRTGDYVDVFWITPANTVRQLLVHKRVIYVVPQADPASAGISSPTGTAFALGPMTVQEASDLINAQINGEIRIGLSSPASNPDIQGNESNDDWMSNTYKVTLPGLTPPVATPAPSESPAATGLPLPTETPAGSPAASPTPTETPVAVP